MLTVCATVVLAAGLAVVWVRVVKTLTESSSGPTTVGKPGALVWDGRVFTSSGQMKAFLTSKGLSYSRWAARHPTAFATPVPSAIKHTTTTATTATKGPSEPAKHRVAAPTVSSTKSRPLTSMVLTVFLLILGLILGASAALPPRYAPIAVQDFYADPDRRMVAVAASAAILLGFAVSFYLT